MCPAIVIRWLKTSNDLWKSQRPLPLSLQWKSSQWESWCLKATATRQFIQQFVYADIKDSLTATAASSSSNFIFRRNTHHWTWAKSFVKHRHNCVVFYDGPGGSFHTNFTWNARVTISQKLRMNYIRNSDALHMNFLRSSYKFLMNYTWNHISIFHVNFVCISYVRLVKITRSNAK